MTVVRINGNPVEAEGFMWDGCHKIYLIDSPEALQQMLESGWSEDDILPLGHLAEAWGSSCGLRFITSGDFAQDYISQEEDGTVTVEAGPRG